MAFCPHLLAVPILAAGFLREVVRHCRELAFGSADIAVDYQQKCDLDVVSAAHSPTPHWLMPHSPPASKVAPGAPRKEVGDSQLNSLASSVDAKVRLTVLLPMLPASMLWVASTKVQLIV